MKSIMSVNVKKFKEIDVLNFYNLIKDRIDGIELSFNIDDLNEVKYVEDLVYLCNRDNFHIQFHGDSTYSLETQIKYLELINSFTTSIDYKINIVMHSIYDNDKAKSLELTTAFINSILDYIDNNLNITISLENLNSFADINRLSKEEIIPILYNIDKLKFTYDMGHEIIDFGKLTDLSEIEIEKINNVHLHTFTNTLDHQPIYSNTLNRQTIVKCILFLKSIHYKGPIVYEYDIYATYGNSIYDKLENFLKSIESLSTLYK